MPPKLLTLLASTIAAFVFLFPGASDTSAQRRDYLTDAEMEIVRDAQNIDMRVDVLTKMIDRRFNALGIDVGGWKEPAKAAAQWGEAPKGTRLQLLTDIRQLLQKSVDDIDDVAAHDANGQAQNKIEGKLFPKAVRSLAAASQRYLNVLKPLAEKTADEKEKGTMLSSIELCDQILEAVSKLPPEKPKGKS
jgi:hypothetical protein